MYLYDTSAFLLQQILDSCMQATCQDVWLTVHVRSTIDVRTHRPVRILIVPVINTYDRYACVFHLIPLDWRTVTLSFPISCTRNWRLKNKSIQIAFCCCPSSSCCRPVSQPRRWGEYWSHRGEGIFWIRIQNSTWGIEPNDQQQI